ncbi:MAG: pyridoxal 5'-phosphate synthase lyase subunit PdxS [Bacillota bacterium]
MGKQGYRLTVSLAEMLVGGVIIAVNDPQQAAMAEAAGASGVLVVPRLAADLRVGGGVGRMADPAVIAGVQAAVSIPVMAACRIGHQVEAEILAELGVDYIDECELLTAVDESRPIDKASWSTPFICGAEDLASALRRIDEGAAIIRSTGAYGSGNVAGAAQSLRQIQEEARSLQLYERAELPMMALEMGVDEGLLQDVALRGRLPVVTIGAGGVVSPADAALLRRLGADCVLVGSGVFRSTNPAQRAAAIVTATAHFDDREIIARVSHGLGREMTGWTGQAVSPAFAEATDERWGW